MLYTVTGIWERKLPTGGTSHYLQVEQTLRGTNRIEKVWINPLSIPEDLDTSTVKVGDAVEITDPRFEYGNIHAIACRCSKCSGLLEEIMKKAAENGTIVINTSDKTPAEVVKEVIRLTK